jgi:hypothetical protein
LSNYCESLPDIFERMDTLVEARFPALDHQTAEPRRPMFPLRGLDDPLFATFREVDAGLFFGRKTEVEKHLPRAQHLGLPRGDSGDHAEPSAANSVAPIDPSGLGKLSIVRRCRERARTLRPCTVQAETGR